MGFNQVICNKHCLSPTQVSQINLAENIDHKAYLNKIGYKAISNKLHSKRS